MYSSHHKRLTQYLAVARVELFIWIMPLSARPAVECLVQGCVRGWAAIAVNFVREPGRFWDARRNPEFAKLERVGGSALKAVPSLDTLHCYARLTQE